MLVKNVNGMINTFHKRIDYIKRSVEEDSRGPNDINKVQLIMDDKVEGMKRYILTYCKEDFKEASDAMEGLIDSLSCNDGSVHNPSQKQETRVFCVRLTLF